MKIYRLVWTAARLSLFGFAWWNVWLGKFDRATFFITLLVWVNQTEGYDRGTST